MIMRLSNRTVRPLTAAAFALAVLAAPILATQAAAQMSMPQPPPQIVVTGRGEVQVAPDRAQVQVGMETQAKTAALASQENNQKQTAILTAIRALGIPASQIQTLNYSVMPISACSSGVSNPNPSASSPSLASALSWRTVSRNSLRDVNNRYGSSTPRVTKSSISTPR